MSKGIGDSIDKFTTFTGIKKLAKRIFGDDCGCDERKKWLNEKFPYAKKMNQDQKSIFEKTYNNIAKRGFNIVKADEQTILIKLYFEVFGVKKKPTSCGSCVKDTLNKLQRIYESSCDEKTY
tara:strand:- start:90 stop:455 length:366 start_codon:yes stop_codon:yes gene_type:complete